MDHHVDCPVEVFDELDHRGRLCAAGVCRLALEPGNTIELTKFVAYGWSSQRAACSPCATRRACCACVTAGRTGWDELLPASSARYWTISGRVPTSSWTEPPSFNRRRASACSTRSRRAGARAEERAIAAKGLTGTGYDGHAFWDTETFVLPVLTATAPHAARDALLWRYSTIDLARDRAKALNLRGAAFLVADHPRTGVLGLLAGGDRGPARQRRHCAGCRAVRALDGRYGLRSATSLLPLLVETARLWDSVGYDGDDGKFHIDVVTGPDEYTAIVDDNAYIEPDCRTESRRGSRRRAPLAGWRRRPGRPRCRDRSVAWTVADRHGAALRRGPPGPRAGSGLHRSPGLGLREDR